MVMLRRRELTRSAVREKLCADGCISAVRGIKPLCLGRGLQGRHVDGDWSRRWQVGDDKGTVRGLGRGAKITFADGSFEGSVRSQSRGNGGMILVRNESIPRQRREKLLPDGELLDPRRIDVIFPAGRERP